MLQFIYKKVLKKKGEAISMNKEKTFKQGVKHLEKKIIKNNQKSYFRELYTEVFEMEYMENVNNTIKKMHKKNKNSVPEYLDKIKEERNLKVKEEIFDNDFLKYML